MLYENKPHILFESERLSFRQWFVNDVEKMFRINSDDKVMQYFPKKATLEETIAFIEKMNNKFDSDGYCYFAVELKFDESFIGFIGLNDQTFESAFTPCIDIGWRLDVAHWGKGYAQEGAKRCLKLAKENLQLTVIKSIAPQVNQPSINVMKKIGMHQEGTFTHPLLKDVAPALSQCTVFSIVL